MLKNLMRGAAACALLAILPAATAGAATPTSLPTVKRTVSASTSSTTYTAPISGYVSARLSAAKGDWDLVVRNARTNALVGRSEGFRSDEVVQTWVQAGDRLVAQGVRKAGAARTARVTFNLVDVAPPKVATPQQLVRVQANPLKLNVLDGVPGFDVTESRGADYVDVIVDGPAQIARLKAMGLKYTVRETDMGALDRKTFQDDARYSARVAASPLPSGRTEYRNYDDIQAELKDIATKHPDTVKPLVLGTSFQGREIQGLEIADNVKGDDGRPVFFLMATHHAREWPSAEMAMEFAHLLVDGNGGPRVQSLLKRERIVIVPLVNPDGYIASRDTNPDPYDSTGVGALETAEAVGAGGNNAYRRKNCDGAIPNGNMPCQLQWGVDNNRNYGNLWGGSGSSQDPGSQSFHGPGPRSEPETQAVWNFVRTHQVTNLISLHTVAALVLRPPGMAASGKAPDEAAMKSLGDKMADATGYTSEFGFQLYDTAGTTEDDSYAATGGYGYTIEVGPEGGHFHADYLTNVIKEWTGDNPKAKNRGGLKEALLLGAEAAASDKDHAILEGKATPGRTLRLHKEFITATSEYCPMGVSPDISVGELPDQLSCPGGTKQPIALHDTIDTTTVVPKDGKFRWDINQSTRPFAEGGSEKDTIVGDALRAPTTYEGDPNTQDVQVMKFVVKPEDSVNAFRVELTGHLPAEDYDLTVFRIVDGKRVQVGSSAGPTGHEVVDLPRPEAGSYEAEVTPYTAVSQNYTVTAAPFKLQHDVSPTGGRETYSFTCEDGKGNVLSRQSVFIERGQKLAIKPGC